MTIRRKIITSFLLISLLIILLGSVAFFHDIEQARHSALHEATAIARTLSLFIAHDLKDNVTPLNIQEHILDLKNIHKRDIVVVSPDKKIIADAVTDEIGKTFSHDRGDEVGETLRDGNIRLFVEESAAYPHGIRQVVVPMDTGQGDRLGAIIMEYTPLYIEARDMAIDNAVKFIAVYIVAVAFSLFAGYRISRKIAEPLRDMQDAARQIADGDLNTRISCSTSDELCSLADSLNRMTLKLQHSRRSLLLSHRSLEGEIGERRQIEAELREALRRIGDEKAKTNAIIEGLGVGLILQDLNYRILYENRHQQKSIGNHVGEFCYSAYSKIDHVCEDCPMVRSLVDRGIHRTERMVEGNGGSKHYELISSPLLDSDGNIIGGIKVVKDITDFKLMEETIRRQAYFDNLTGLPNRVLFVEHLNREIAAANRHNRKIAVLFLDLDRFKNINDTLGHSTGDALLKEVAQRLRSCIRESDTVARIGGDEFNMILTDVRDTEAAAVTARKITALFEEPYLIDGYELYVSTSIGISMYPDDGKLNEDLIRNADIAMYHAKEEGINMFRFYDPCMNTKTLERIMMENSLRQSIDRGELRVYYQPQVDVSTLQIKGVEALVRWQHPERGLLMPAEFLPISEEIGFITAIDEWVLRSACEQQQRWLMDGLPPVCMTVNLSEKQFRSADFADTVVSVLDATGMAPQYLDLEITENVAMHDIERIMPAVVRLTDMGIRFSIDDFGTGYSSLGHLRKLPIRKLKIDKSFITDFTQDQDNETIINAIISLAHNLNLSVIAEGVEYGEQFEFLNSAGCDEIQGFVFSAPVPAQHLQAMLSETNCRCFQPLDSARS